MTRRKKFTARVLDYPIGIIQVVYKLDYFFHLQACLKCSYLFHSRLFLILFQ